MTESRIKQHSNFVTFLRRDLEGGAFVGCTGSLHNIGNTLKQEDLSFESQLHLDLEIKLEVNDPLLTEIDQINFPRSPVQNSLETEESYQFLPIQSFKKENGTQDFQAGNNTSLKRSALTHSTTIFPCVLDSFSVEEKFSLKRCYVLINRIESCSRTKPEDEMRYACDDRKETSFKGPVQKPRRSQRISNVTASYSNGDHEIMHPFNCQRKCNSCQDKSLMSAPFHLNKKENRYSCDECNKTFLKKDNLLIHMGSHFNKEGITYTCDRCSKYYSRKDTLLRHIQAHCSAEKCCKFCSLLLENQTSLNEHLILAHKNKMKRWRCKDCGKFFLNNDGLQHHCSVTKLLRNLSTFNCILCEEFLPSKSSLREHCFTHHGGRYVCKVCNKTITDASNYYRHLRESHEERRGKSRGGKQRNRKRSCDVCGKWLRERSMKLHQKRHLNEPRPEHLIRSMSKQRYLLNQKLLQLNIKLHKCEDCGALFKNKFHLNRHKNVHKGIKFHCELCDKKFADTSNLRKHWLRQHNLKKEARMKAINYKTS